MTKQLTLTLTLIICCIFSVDAQRFEWVKGLQLDNYSAITSSSDNSIYVTSAFYDSVQFVIKNDTFTLHAESGSDLYVAKMDSEGNTLWVRQITNAEPEQIDSYNNEIVITGSFSNTTDFDPSSSIFELTSKGMLDAFILKLDSSGAFQWAQQIGGSANEIETSLAIDNTGNLLFSATSGSRLIKLNVNGGDTTLTNPQDQSILVKLNSSGNVMWVNQLESTQQGSTSEITHIITDNNNNIYLSGSFAGSVDFNFSENEQNTLSSSYSTADGFVVKLDAEANYIWVSQLHAENYLYRSTSLETDDLNNVYCSGNSRDTVSVNTISDQTRIVPVDMEDNTLIYKLNEFGQYVWGKYLPVKSNYYLKSFAVSNEGNTYLMGNINPLITQPQLIVGLDTLFLNKSNSNVLIGMDTYGTVNWFREYGGISNEIILTDNNELISSGVQHGLVDFNTGSGVAQLSSKDEDYLLKLSICNVIPQTEIDTVNACNNYVWEGRTFTNSNSTAKFVYLDSLGCDSLVKSLYLTLGQDSHSTDSIVACEPITWINGNTYYNSTDTVTYTYSNSSGCDSIVSLDLTILPDTINEFTSACDSATWIDGKTYYTSQDTLILDTNELGCDYVLRQTLQVTPSNISFPDIISCGPYHFLDQEYAESGYYTQVLPNTGSCEELRVSFNLTVLPNLNVEQDGNTLIAEAPDSVSLQWVRCQSEAFIPVVGETNHSFSPEANGEYAVIVNNSNCIDTSLCYTMLVTDIGNEGIGNATIEIFPNPSEGRVNIVLPKRYDTFILQILNPVGIIKQEASFHNTDTAEIEIKKSGLYILEIILDGSQTIRKKIIIE